MYIYDQQAWDDVEHTKLNKEATELLWRIGRTKELASNPVEREDAHYRSMLEPTFKPQPKFTNELTSENATAAQNEIPDTLGVCYPDPLYTLDDNIIPESMRGKDGDPNNIAIKRNLIVIHAEKDIHGHITYKNTKRKLTDYLKKRNLTGTMEKIGLLKMQIPLDLHGAKRKN